MVRDVKPTALTEVTSAPNQKTLRPAGSSEKDSVERMAVTPVRLELLIVLHDLWVPGRAAVGRIPVTRALQESSVLFRAHVEVTKKHPGRAGALSCDGRQLTLPFLRPALSWLQVQCREVNELPLHHHAAQNTGPLAPLGDKLHSQLFLRVQVHISPLNFDVRRSNQRIHVS